MLAYVSLACEIMGGDKSGGAERNYGPTCSKACRVSMVVKPNIAVAIARNSVVVGMG